MGRQQKQYPAQDPETVREEISRLFHQPRPAVDYHLPNAQLIPAPTVETNRLSILSTYGFFVFSIFHNIANQITHLQCQLAEIKTAISPQHFNQMQKQLNYLVQVVKHSQLVINHQQPQKDCFDLTNLLKETKQLITMTLVRKRIQLQVQTPGPMHIKADQVILKQVLLNLIYNSIEALDQVQQIDKKIILALNQTKEQICLTISDNGPGFTNPAEFEPQPFNSQPDLSRPTSTGLGLTYANFHLPKTFAGQVKIDSDQEGARATLFIPKNSTNS